MFQSNSSGSDTKNEVPIEEAADLCVSTYWRSQVRSIAYSAANTSDKLILRQLVVAGVLVAANPRQESVAIDPDEVRFFHDSMQSYLTARGLFRTDKRWDALFRAAGDPGFVSAQSDILTVIGSELFQMCVAVYRPREALRQQLRGHLLLWAKRHGGDLTKNNVIRGLPERILSDPMWTVEERDNAQSLLTKAVQLCTVVDTQSDDASCLSAMYAEIAPIIWTFPNAQDGLDFGLS